MEKLNEVLCLTGLIELNLCKNQFGNAGAI